MATSSVAIPSTRRGWRGHFTFHFPAAISRIRNNVARPDLTRKRFGRILPAAFNAEARRQA